MKRITLLFTLLAVSIAMVGCSGAESTSSTPDPAGKNRPDTPGTTTAEMGKCDECGKELAAASLKDHDGKKICEACLAAHNH